MIMPGACGAVASGMAEAAARVASTLVSKGFAVVDDALPPLAVEAALQGARDLRAAGRARKISSQAAMGRTDEILVLTADQRAPGGFTLPNIPEILQSPFKGSLNAFIVHILILVFLN